MDVTGDWFVDRYEVSTRLAQSVHAPISSPEAIDIDERLVMDLSKVLSTGAPRNQRMAVREYALLAILELCKGRGLKGGDRLPPEWELVEELGISRASLREALVHLQALGTISVRHGVGTVLNPEPEISMLLNVLSLSLQAGAFSRLNLVEVREAIECFAARLCAERHADETYARMTEAIEEMRRAETDEEFIAADIAFHRTIAQATANPLWDILFVAIGGMVRASMHSVISHPERKETALREHMQIAQAIQRGDSDTVQRLIIDHLQVYRSAEEGVRDKPR